MSTAYIASPLAVYGPARACMTLKSEGKASRHDSAMAASRSLISRSAVGNCTTAAKSRASAYCRARQSQNREQPRICDGNITSFCFFATSATPVSQRQVTAGPWSLRACLWSELRKPDHLQISRHDDRISLSPQARPNRSMNSAASRISTVPIGGPVDRFRVPLYDAIYPSPIN